MSATDLPVDVDASVVRSTRLWMGRQRWEQVVADAVPAKNAARRLNHRRRREPRHPYRVSCLIRLGKDGEMGVYSVDTRNISRHGLGFRHDRPVEPNTPCLIALRDAVGCVTLHAAIVRWCSPLEPVGFDTGVEFDQPVAAELIEQADQGPR
ncbi:MAG: PilZ domain-containing protein [Planctomycetota bacterium]